MSRNKNNKTCNWEMKKLGEVCEIIGGSQPSKDNFSNICHDGYVRLIQVRDYRTDKFATYIPKMMVNRFCITTDIMIGRYGPPIFGIFRGLEGAYNVALMKAVPKESIVDKEYFYWFLKTDKLLRYVEKSSARAAGQSGVRKELLYEYPILIPPLPEQKRIVAILDEASAAIDKARANAEKNLANAREVFDSYLNSVFSSKGVGWEEKKLGEIGVITSSKRIYKSEYVKEGIPFYRTKEIKELAHEKDISFELFISKKRYDEIKKNFGVPKEGDILLSAVGTIGEMYVVKKDDIFYFKDGNIVWLKNFDTVDPFYLKYALTSFVEQIKKLSIGSAYNALTIEKLNEYTIPLASLQEQKQIVMQIDELSALTKRLEEIYKQKIANLDELKKSILDMAFKGELT